MSPRGCTGSSPRSAPTPPRSRPRSRRSSPSRDEIGVGVVVGSNVFNLAALLGLSALVAGHVRIHRHGLLLNGGVALAVTGVAVALVLGCIGAVVRRCCSSPRSSCPTWSCSRAPRRVRRLPRAAVREEVDDSRTGEQPAKASRLDLLVLAASLARDRARQHRAWWTPRPISAAAGASPTSIVGTLVLAALTSLPNLLTAVRLALRGRGAATVSEAFNSNSLNVLAGIAIPSLFLSLGAASGLVTFSVWWLLGMTVVAVVLRLRGPRPAAR